MSVILTKPTLPPWELFKKAVQSFYETGMITNGPVVRQLEIEVEDIFRVGHAMAVSSCTSGLMLTLRCLGVKGKVAIPSFTFFATAHAVDWNGLEPVFVDVDEETWTMSPEALRKAVAEHEGIKAVMPVHVFGNPCEVKELEAISNAHFGGQADVLINLDPCLEPECPVCGYAPCAQRTAETRQQSLWHREVVTREVGAEGAGSEVGGEKVKGG